MPLCMRQLHKALEREHKLKHWGRLQYGLFLKGAGLGVDDAMAFWQVQVSKDARETEDSCLRQLEADVLHDHSKPLTNGTHPAILSLHTSSCCNTLVITVNMVVIVMLVKHRNVQSLMNGKALWC